ncbi:hypothetical protein Chor_007766 [Crotalus horridus]
MQGEVWKVQTLKELIEILHHLFASDKVNVAEVQTLMESYESNPDEWTKYAQFDQFSYCHIDGVLYNCNRYWILFPCGNEIKGLDIITQWSYLTCAG